MGVYIGNFFCFEGNNLEVTLQKKSVEIHYQLRALLVLYRIAIRNTPNP
jgi:hypothetical protein